MFSIITPEQAGISSRFVTRFINTLNRRGLTTHSVLLMKGDDIFAEYYWAPFTKDTVHRMYSQTKSYVAIAIGLLEEDGKLCLDDCIAGYFPEKIERELPEYLKKLTIKDMLTMSTCGEPAWWFAAGDPDRTHLYLNGVKGRIPSGMRWEYDSPGSQVLSSLVEKLSGQSLFDFLNDRVFRFLGTFKTATILKTPNGDCWGDSALVCTPRDMASFARLLMKEGSWDGRQLINREFVKTATSKVVDNQDMAFDDYYQNGYGYQIWRLPENAFSFNGMGCQLTACLPEKDLTFVITSDNQGFAAAKSLIYSAFYENIVDNMGDSPLPEDAEAYKEALNLGEDLKLSCIGGKSSTGFAKELSGRKYICDENRAGMTEFGFEFKEDETGVFYYTNAQGEKALPFGLCKNVFTKFPQLGYSNDAGCVPTTDGFMYDCAASAAWREEKKLLLRVQIIDRYLGNLFAIFSFKDELATVTMCRNAEAFLDEYQGEFAAHLKKGQE